MPGFLLGAPKLQLFDDDGDPLAGGKVHTYQAGTSSNKATYTDSGLVTPNANPVILDSAGRATVYLTPGEAYKFVCTDANDVQLWTQDNVTLGVAE